MAFFFPDLLDQFTENAFLEKVSRKFHFDKTQLPKLQEVAEEMLPWMREEAFWERRDSRMKDRPGDTSDTAYEDVVMSLGGGVDCLQERYTEGGALSESYMLETLAGELLMEGYGAYNRYIRENTDMHVARYFFPGSEESLPLEMVPVLLAGFQQKITCNSAFCIVPKKSVVFIAQLTQDMQVQCESICTGCSNIHCPARVEDDSPGGRMLAKMADLPLSYGYSRIFGARFRY